MYCPDDIDERFDRKRKALCLSVACIVERIVELRDQNGGKIKRIVPVFTPRVIADRASPRPPFKKGVAGRVPALSAERIRGRALPPDPRGPS